MKPLSVQAQEYYEAVSAKDRAKSYFWPTNPGPMRKFNSLVQRFDFLTCYSRDRSTVSEIWDWYQANDPALVFEFFRAARDLGYFKQTPNPAPSGA